MTQEELEALRILSTRVRPYQRSTQPASPTSFPRFINDELGIKIHGTLLDLIQAVKALDTRMRDLEDPEDA